MKKMIKQLGGLKDREVEVKKNKVYEG